MRTEAEIGNWLVAQIAARCSLEKSQVDPDRDLAEYCLESSEAVDLALALELWLDREIDLTLFWEEKTVNDFVRAICRQA
ncbi:acyl carrier protein [Bradyrhizobium prioriisuperbiae]|uniref:acyl carrier protein n=1 Tax=Bradyrhizobium prioriisuperbiae TaxID=2854389 RepID=UPI0028E574A0|nr:acyl carrier protein [Bradyrhizobium prioritasuperba]